MQNKRHQVNSVVVTLNWERKVVKGIGEELGREGMGLTKTHFYTYMKFSIKIISKINGPFSVSTITSNFPTIQHHTRQHGYLKHELGMLPHWGNHMLARCCCSNGGG